MNTGNFLEDCNPCGTQAAEEAPVLPYKDIEADSYSQNQSSAFGRALADESPTVVSEEIDVDECSQSTTKLLSRRNMLRMVLGLLVVAAVIVASTLPGRNRNNSDSSDTPAVSSFQEEDASPTLQPTLSPTSQLEMTLEYQVLKPYVNPPEKLLDDSTPQGKAFAQLLSEGISEDFSFRIKQRFSMISLFFATNGGQWAWTNGWDTFSAEECDWQGVAICRYRNGRRVVTGIQLPSNKISGEIPEELCLLEDLESLVLGNNELVGPVPACITSLESLFEIDLHNNDLSGMLPAGLTAMDKLIRLDLSDNDFSGNLGVLFGSNDAKQSRITKINLNNNAFAGDITETLFLPEGLQELTLHKNALIGDISTLCSQSSVTLLTADCSQLACGGSCCTCF